jgi:hypothetical protein
VSQFSTDKKALDFIAGRIAAEAAREGIPLSEIERKMLYFSETDWTLPGMAEISEEFDREYDQGEYERKIGGLVRRITAHGHGGNEAEQHEWDAAILKLGEGDHYLSVLTSAGKEAGHGFLPTLDSGPVRPPHDILKLWLTGLAIVFGLFGVMAAGSWLFGARFWAAADWVFDRNHRWFVVLAPVAVWTLWILRRDLKTIVRDLLKRP